MPEIKQSLLYLLAGVGAVTLIDTVGSIASRKLKFNYTYLSFLSIIVYTGTSIAVAKNASALLAICTVLLVGFYDASVGWVICQKLRANYPIPADMKDKITLPYRLFAVLLFTIPCGLVGIWLA